MSTTSLWALHGLVVSSPDIALDARRAPAHVDPDVVVRLCARGRVLAHGEAAPGRLMAFVEVGTGLSLSVAEDPQGVVVYFHGHAEATINPAGTVIDLVLAPGADSSLASVWIGGTVISVLLALRGHPVLHASAVTVPARDGEAAVAFVGRSGMGKSTMATLACRDGARLLADDVLRTDIASDDRVVAWPGATATRLRPAAQALGEQAALDSSITADGRLSASLSLAPGATPVHLAALVVPQPDRSASQIEVEQVRGVMAVLTLASYPRIVGWSDPVTSAQAHAHWGELARRVPVFIARVPWGPPFLPGLGAQIVEAVLKAR